MKSLERKLLYLDAETLRNIHSIRAERLRLGLTQKELANLLGLNVDSLKRYEYCSNYPSLGVYIKLAEIFGWDIRESENYKFYKYFRQGKNQMKVSKYRYGFSNRELGHYAGIGKSAAGRVIAKDVESSVWSYMQVKEVLSEEVRRSKLRRSMK